MDKVGSELNDIAFHSRMKPPSYTLSAAAINSVPVGVELRAQDS